MTVSELIMKLQTMPQDAQVIGYSSLYEGDIDFKNVTLTNFEKYLNTYYCQYDSELAFNYETDSQNANWVRDENGNCIWKLCNGIENKSIVILH